ncbi:MAG: nicotinate (nicotinamide) nucleotide adenylyltransferase [Bacteroidota bacterium]
MTSTKKIGLFFGSFNPIHIGHLIIANIMAENTDLNKVWFVVSPQNPLKPSHGLLHEFDRYDLVRVAIGDHYKLEVTDVEFNLPKPSYTIHTLTHLTEKYPANEFKVIIGEDNLNNFVNWKNYEEILEQYGLYVYPRLNSSVGQARHDVTSSDLIRHPNVKMVEAPLLDISATYIRNCIKANKSIRYLVPETVEQMIKSKYFYH